MEEQIRKMQQQSKAPPQSTQTTSDMHQDTVPAPAPLNTIDTSDTQSTTALYTLQTENTRPSNPTAPTENTSTPTAPTEDTSTPSTDMNISTPEQLKKRRGNFPEARRTHDPP